MERLILECSIRAVLAALAAGAILGILRVRTAAPRHRVWAGMVVFMLILPLWALWGPKAQWLLLPAPAKPASLRNVGPIAAQPVAAAPATHTSAIPSHRPVSNALAAPARPFRWSLSGILLGVYLLGAAWLLIRLAIGTVGTRRLRRMANPSRAGFLTSDICYAPVSVGWWRPAIILPNEWREWTLDQFDAVLAHEHAHVDRHDPFWQWLALLNRALFWFHPLSWWLERKLAGLAEEACDAAVLEGGYDPAAYAEHLLEIERSVRKAGARMPALGMPALGAQTFGAGLPRRVRLILDGPRLPRVSRARMFGAAVACSAAAAVFGAGTVGRLPQPQRGAPGPQLALLNAQPAPSGSGILLAQAASVPQRTVAAVPQSAPALIGAAMDKENDKASLEEALSLYRAALTAPANDRVYAAYAQYRISQILAEQGHLADSTNAMQLFTQNYSDYTSLVEEDLHEEQADIFHSGTLFLPQQSKLPAGRQQNGTYHHNSTGVEFPLDGWKLNFESGSSGGGEMVGVADPGFKMSVQVWLRPDTLTPASIPDLLRGTMQEKILQRLGFQDYRISPRNVISETIGGKQALFAQADYVQNNQPWSELLTWIYTEKTRVQVFTSVRTADLTALRPRYDQFAQSVVVP